jgi:pantoate--beta-alanine ligase
MEIISTKEHLVRHIQKVKGKGNTIGFVPTMGSLHRGHLSLIQMASEQCDFVVTSIFVNPTQFNEKQDFEAYPRHVDQDLELLKDHACDLAFIPKTQEIYPDGIHAQTYPVGALANVMEGAQRPGHFNGVIQVVRRLFELVTPDKAIFGEKDFQQLAIIRWMTKYFMLPVEIVGAPIIRDENGLALSSRNQLLDRHQILLAQELSRSLRNVKDSFQIQGISQAISCEIKRLNSLDSLELEYLQSADESSLQPIVKTDWPEHVRLFIAARLGNVRLIDNMRLF